MAEGEGPPSAICCCTAKVEPGEKKGLELAPRKTTDVLCLIIFLGFWVVMAVIGYWGMTNGVPERLLYGQDMDGNQCGKGTMLSKKLTYYPKLNEDIIQSASSLNLDPLNLAGSLSSIKFSGLCMAACPSKGAWVCNAAGDTFVAGKLTGTVTKENYLNSCKALAPGGLFVHEFPLVKGTDCGTALANCWTVPAAQREILFRCIDNWETNTTVTYYCADPTTVGPDDASCKTKLKIELKSSEEPSQPNYLVQMLTSTASVINALFGDLMKSYIVVIVVALVGGLLCGFAWTILLRYFAAVIVWATIFGLFFSMIVFTFFAFVKAGIISDPSIALALSTASTALGNSTGTSIDTSAATNQQKEYWTIGAIAGAVVDVIFLVLLIAVKHQIHIALQIIKVSTKALADMKELVIFPVWTVVWTAIIFGYCGAVFAYLQTAGAMTSISLPGVGSVSFNATAYNATGNTSSPTGQAIQTLQSLPMKDYAMAVNFFGLLWGNAFVQGVGILTICSCYVKWYCRADPKEKMGAVMIKSYGETLRYHLGSVAFGSFIIALVQFIRYLFEYIQKQTEAAKDNKMVKIIICVIRCCLWCFEKFVKYVTKSAYIVIALKSKPFFYAAMEAFWLIFTNGAQVAVMAFVGSLVCVVGKFVIVAACGALAYVWLTFDPTYSTGDTAITSPIMPVLFTVLLAYFVAGAFMEVYGMGIDSLLVCYIADKAKGDPHDLQGYKAIMGMPNVSSKGKEDGTASKGGKPETEETKPAPDAEDDDDGMV